MKKSIAALLVTLSIGANAPAQAQAQGFAYRVDLKRPDNSSNSSMMTVSTMLLGQKGMVDLKDGTGSFSFTVEPKEVQTDGTVKAVASFDSTKDGLPIKDTIPLDLKRGESKQLFSTASLQATVTLLQ